MNTPNGRATEYTVCTGNTRAELAEDVTDALRQGWECQGDLVVANTGGVFNALVFFQPMVR